MLWPNEKCCGLTYLKIKTVPYSEMILILQIYSSLKSVIIDFSDWFSVTLLLNSK